jgi:mono/diheme cytochrome c family protein
MRTPVCLRFVVAAVLLAITASAARGTDRDGRSLYLRHCASCHGFEAKGDGPDADAFAEKPRNLREGFLRKYSTGEIVQRIRNGVPLELALDLPALKSRASEVNALADHLKRLPTVDWEMSYAGWDIYAYRCQVCHGPYGAPTKDLPAGVRPPRNLSEPAFQRSIGDDELLAVVRHGRKGMPALVPRVPESDGPALGAFVRLLSPGFQLYSRYCASCHGDDGLGGDSPPGSFDAPDVKLDRAYLARTDPQRLHDAIWHMVEDQKPAMPHYRWTISDAQAAAIVEYLRGMNQELPHRDH